MTKIDIIITSFLQRRSAAIWGIMKKKRSIEKYYSKWGYIFIIPFVVIFMIYNFWPLASTLYYAFCDLRHALKNDPVFLPLAGQPLNRNFVEVFESTSFKDAFKNTFIFFFAATIPEWIVAFWLAAVMTDRRLKLKGRMIFKTAFFLPNIIPVDVTGAVATVIVMMLTAAMMNGFGVTDQDFEFFTSMQFFIIVMTVLLHFGITFIYAVAGITGIPPEVFEAAEIDGANRVQIFFHVTIPCMKPMMFFITVVTLVDGLGAMDVPSMFGMDLMRRNLTLMQYIENQAWAVSAIFDRASAASLILLGIHVFFATIVYFIFIRDKDEAKLRKLMRKERREAKRIEKAKQALSEG